MFNLFFSQFKTIAKNLLVFRLVLMLVFASLHPSLAYAKTVFTMPAKPVVVAVIDEGVDFSHPDLKNYQWTNSKEIPNNKIDDDKNGYVDDTFGWNFLDNSSNMEIKGGHGTKLSGLIVPSGQIMPLIVCAKDYGCNQSAIIQAIYYATDNGARVINLSLGDTSGYKTAYDASIKYAYEHNVVVVASSGNAEVGYSLSKKPMSPICNDNGKNMVLGVGTIDDKGNRPSWSNFGSCIDLSAKGANISTTLSPVYNKKLYGSVEGNSYSTAIVSGQVALIISQHEAYTPAEVIDFIKNNNTQTKNQDKNINTASVKKIIPKPKLVIR